MTPTPSPRPAALVEAMKGALNAIYGDRTHGDSLVDNTLDEMVAALLNAADYLGWTLIPRAELEEAADYIEAGPYEGEPTDADRAMAAKLRQRSRG